MTRQAHAKVSFNDTQKQIYIILSQEWSTISSVHNNIT